MSGVTILRGDAPQQARSLYRQLLRQSSAFPAYNFREYARRKTRDEFREHVAESDPRRVQELLQKGIQQLQMLKRQTTISQFYRTDALVVEASGNKAQHQLEDKGDIVLQKDDGAS